MVVAAIPNDCWTTTIGGTLIVLATINQSLVYNIQSLVVDSVVVDGGYPDYELSIVETLDSPDLYILGLCPESSTVL